MKTIILIGLCLGLFPKLLWADKGEVVKTISGCDYFLVETENGYSLLETVGADTPDKDDEVVGTLNEYGSCDIYDITTDSEISVYVDDFYLTEEDALDQLVENCD